MPRSKESSEMDGESNDTLANSVAQGRAAHVSATPPFPATAFSAIPNSGAQFPFVDPSVMMTIAAASVQQQLTQGRVSQPGAGGTSPVPPGIAPALSGALNTATPHAFAAPQPAQISPHMAAAALLGATGAQAQLHKSLPGVQVGDSSSYPSAAVAAHAATRAPGANVMLPSMQTWSLEQLEQYVNLLHQSNQQIPQSVALLLADARRKEDKRTAKRVANRKSACTSRARKKALVEEMTRTNARLRRQAMILALLPDLVVAINVAGEITFCSAQVEKVLLHKIDDLIGAKLRDLLVPASRDTLSVLIEELVNSEKTAASATNSRPPPERNSSKRRSNQRNSSDTTESKTTEENDNENGNGNSNVSGRGSSRSGGRSGGNVSAAAVVSEQSFPLSVVEVESKQSARATRVRANVNSDTSSSSNGGGKQQAVSSLTNSTNLSRSPTASSSGEDDGRGSQARAKNGKRLPSSDDSSSLSSDAKNMRNANENLDRNVRWHNERMKGDNKSTKLQDGPKDDVTGASVTANNATARLSSLQHLPERAIAKTKDDKSSRYESTGDQSSSDDSLLAGVEEKKKGENASDDSGYRESNDSREETSSSGSDTSNSNGQRKKPLAPTCQVCLIRDDLSTIWCEVTSSIRTRSLDEEPDTATQSSTSLSGPTPVKSSTSSNEANASPKEATKEILLCLRPIRDGEKKVNESLRFIQKKKSSENSGPTTDPTGAGAVVSSSSTEPINQENSGVSSKDASESASKENSAQTAGSKRPQKKRPPPEAKGPTGSGTAADDQKEKPSKRMRGRENDDSRSSTDATDTEKSVVESLMLMSNKSQ